MKSHAWKPLVYLSVSLGATVLALALSYLLVVLFIPGFSLRGLRRAEGKLTLVVAGGIAYGTVIATNWLLKRYLGRKFGTYLDDPDEAVEGPRPSLEKRCLRFSTVFGAFHNDFHATGYCSRTCREAFARSREAQ